MPGEAVADDEEILTDVCIIGAGPAGITIASELDSKGVRVCLLEAGGRDVEQRLQRQSRGQSDGYPIHRLHRSRVRAFGGALRHPHFWDGHWAARPLDPIDFAAREGRPEFGWPFDRKHLDPYYTRAASICGIRPFDVATTVWSEQVSTDGRLIGSSPELEPAIFQYTRPAFHDAWHDLSSSSNVRLLLETRAVEIRLDSTGRRVDSIVAVRRGCDPVVIRPRLLVFAAGGIENARLLLTANAGRGLGNEHDLVGRYFAERLWLHAGHVVLSDKTSVDQLGCFHGPEGADIGGGLRVAEEVQRERQLLNVAFFLVPRPAAVTSNAVRSLLTLRKAVDRRPLIADIGWHTGNVLIGARDLANLAMSRVVSRPRVLALRAQGEQAPNRESRVTLGSRTDDLGIRVARVTWRMTDRRPSIHRGIGAGGRHGLAGTGLRVRRVDGAPGQHHPPRGPLPPPRHHQDARGSTAGSGGPRLPGPFGRQPLRCRILGVPNLRSIQPHVDHRRPGPPPCRQTARGAQPKLRARCRSLGELSHLGTQVS